MYIVAIMVEGCDGEKGTWALLKEEEEEGEERKEREKGEEGEEGREKEEKELMVHLAN